MSRRFKRYRLVRNESGSIVVLGALLLAASIGFAGLAIDGGYQNLLREQLQDVADAAAHAGALGLNLTAAGLDQAYDNAVALAGANTLSGQSYLLEPGEFETGIWNPEYRVFTPDSSHPAKINAVRITPKYTVDPLVAGVLMPELKFQGAAVSVAARYPLSSGCALPIAVPSCAFAGKQPSDICGMDLIFNADGIDTTGWANLGASQPNATTIRTQIQDAADGVCEFSDDSRAEEDVVTLNNGAITNALKEVRSAVEKSPTYWNSSELGSLPRQDPKSSILPGKYGSTLEGLIYVFNDPRGCNGTKFTGSAELAGYAQAVIYDVIDSGKVADRKIKARISCKAYATPPTSSTAGNFGVLGGVAIVQ